MARIRDILNKYLYGRPSDKEMKSAVVRQKLASLESPAHKDSEARTKLRNEAIAQELANEPRGVVFQQMRDAVDNLGGRKPASKGMTPEMEDYVKSERAKGKNPSTLIEQESEIDPLRGVSEEEYDNMMKKKLYRN